MRTLAKRSLEPDRGGGQQRRLDSVVTPRDDRQGKAAREAVVRFQQVDRAAPRFRAISRVQSSLATASRTFLRSRSAAVRATPYGNGLSVRSTCTGRTR